MLTSTLGFSAFVSLLILIVLPTWVGASTTALTGTKSWESAADQASERPSTEFFHRGSGRCAAPLCDGSTF